MKMRWDDISVVNKDHQFVIPCGICIIMVDNSIITEKESVSKETKQKLIKAIKAST